MPDPTGAKLSIDAVLEALRSGKAAHEGAAYGGPAGFAHGTMSLEAIEHAASGDWVTRERDLIYFVLRGRCEFQRRGDTQAAKTGDALFVSSGDRHRIASPSEDFAAWCVLWGPSEGEAPSPEISRFASIDA